jgi:hypothetical protein
VLERIKARNHNLTKGELRDELNLYVNKAIQPDEVDLVYPSVDQQVDLDQFHDMMHIFD